MDVAKALRKEDQMSISNTKFIHLQLVKNVVDQKNLFVSKQTGTSRWR